MVELRNIKRRKLASPPKPVITKLGGAWLSAADALAHLVSVFGRIDDTQAAIADCLRSGKLRGFAHELNLIDPEDWGKDAKRDLSRAERAGFVHSTWLGPYPESIGLTENFWRQSPNPALETPNWDWADGNFVAGMFGKNLEPKKQYWVARAIVFNAFEIESLGERRRLGHAISSEGEQPPLSSANEPGRPPSSKWANWIALWVAYCISNKLSKNLDPDALAADIDQRLKEREIGRIDRRAAKSAIQATLNYVCKGSGKPPNTGLPD